MDWKKKHADDVQKIAEDWIPVGVTGLDILQKLFVPYVANWSFRERLPVVENPEDIKHPASISVAYARLASLISSGFAWDMIELDVYDIERRQDKAKIAELEIRGKERSAKIRTSWVHAAAMAAAMGVAVTSVSFMLLTYKEVVVGRAQLQVAEIKAMAAEDARAKAEAGQREADAARKDAEAAQMTTRELLVGRNQKLDKLNLDFELLAQSLGSTQQNIKDPSAELNKVLQELAKIRESVMQLKSDIGNQEGNPRSRACPGC